MSTTTTVAPASAVASSAAEHRSGTDRAAGQRSRVWTAGLLAGSVAAVATMLTVLLARAFGVDVAIQGEQIPTATFVVLSLVGAGLGIAIARLCRRASRPQATFIAVTVALTGLSIIPDLVADATWASRLVLATTHVIAATIIVPTIAHRLEP